MAGRWATFKGWHGESSFWREIYARTVAGLCTAAVIFLFAVAAGYVRLHREGVISIGSIFIVGTMFLITHAYFVIEVRKHHKKTGGLIRPRPPTRRNIFISAGGAAITLLLVGVFIAVVNLLAA